MLPVITGIILFLLLLFFVVPLFIKNDYQVSASVNIKKPVAEVFDYVKYIANQVYYNKWVMADPNVKRTTIGTDGAVGFVNAWDSQVKSVGKGEQEIILVRQGERIDSVVRFEKPFKNTARVEMTTTGASPDTTSVSWIMNGRNKYPMNMMNLFIPGMLEKDMTESLGNLKAVLEKQ